MIHKKVSVTRKTDQSGFWESTFIHWSPLILVFLIFQTSQNTSLISIQILDSCLYSLRVAHCFRQHGFNLVQGSPDNSDHRHSCAGSVSDLQTDDEEEREAASRTSWLAYHNQHVRYVSCSISSPLTKTLLSWNLQNNLTSCCLWRTLTGAKARLKRNFHRSESGALLAVDYSLGLGLCYPFWGRGSCIPCAASPTQSIVWRAVALWGGTCRKRGFKNMEFNLFRKK